MADINIGPTGASVFALIVLLAQGALVSALGFLGGLATPMVGLAFAGAGIATAMSFKPTLQGVGAMLVGASGILAGLSAFGVNVGFTATAAAGLGLALIVVGSGVGQLARRVGIKLPI